MPKLVTEWEEQQIEIILTYPDTGEEAGEVVTAKVYGTLAVVQAVRYFSVTHVPTGLCVLYTFSQEDARRVVEKLYDTAPSVWSKETREATVEALANLSDELLLWILKCREEKRYAY